MPLCDRRNNPDVEVTSYSEEDKILDDDWDIGDLNDAGADIQDKRELLRQIRSYCEYASEAVPCSIKDLLEAVHCGFMTSWALCSERRRVSYF